MSTYVVDSKLVTEVISARANFLSRMATDEVLLTCASSISVFSGVDLNPEAMLVGLPSIEEARDVVQQVQEGLPGVIYTLWLSGRTDLNNVLVQELKIAVLPTEAVTPPEPS